MKKICHIVTLCMLTLLIFTITACAQKDSDSTQTTIKNDSDSASAESSDNTQTSSEEDTGTESETSEKVLATDFEVTLVTGEKVKLSDYRGKKVLLNFWATWCGPCVKEMPAFQRLYEDYPDDFVILAVNCGDSASDVKDFVDENSYTFNIAIDESLEASSLYPTSSIPLTLIIDEDGYVIYGAYGASDADTMYERYKNELGL